MPVSYFIGIGFNQKYAYDSSKYKKYKIIVTTF